MGVEAYPLQWPEGWPRTRVPRRARFETSFAQARDGLMDEVRLMGGRHVVLSTNVPLKGNGLPYARQPEPDDKGAAVYWTTRGGEQRCMACDRWDRVRDNVRALQLSINAMRDLERWGGSYIVDRAFTGFQRLEAPGERTWSSVLRVDPRAPFEEISTAYRHRRSETHPDNGGDPDEFRLVCAAFESAKRAHGRA